MSHYVDRFRAALAVLAGHGHIKQRLIDAFEHHLRDIDVVLLPRPIKEPFDELKTRMTQVAPLNGEGPICASVRKMSIEEADGCAHTLVDLYADMIRHCGEIGDPPDTSKDESADVPAMLLKSV